jgi:hypothetical protein
MPDPDSRRRAPLSTGEWAAIGFSLVVAGSVTFLWWRQHRPAPQPTAPITSTPIAADASEPPPGAAITASPQDVRRWLEPVSADPLFRRALEGDDVLTRWAVLTDNLAEGVSPRRVLEPLSPSRPFSVTSAGDGTAIAPESYARYDAFADAVASVDAAALGRAFRALHAALDGAYRALGYPPGALDRATARALHRIEASPVRDGEVRVDEKGGVYVFADPELEALRPVEKHLLRMGPRNTRLLQAKAHELEAALGLGDVTPAAR